MSLLTSAKQLEKKVAGVLTIALPLSLIIFVYEREIVPLYGSGPTMEYLDKVMLAAMLLSAVQPYPITTSVNFLLTAIALTVAPNATYWVAVLTARRHDALWGPIATHAAVLGPLSFLLASFVIQMEDPDVAPGSGGRPNQTLRLIRATMTFLITFLLFQHVWAPSHVLNTTSASQVYLVLAGIFYTLYIWNLQLGESSPTDAPTTTPKKNKVVRKQPSRLSSFQMKAALIAAFCPFWYSMNNIFYNPVLDHPIPQRYNHPTYPLQVLMSEQSVTGLVTVADWLPPSNYKPGDNEKETHSVRYMRVAHSLLGGVWIRDKVQMLDNEPPLKDVYNTPLGDTIYATFIVQEAVRLVNSTDDFGKAGRTKKALVIGLGTGVSANALMSHDVSTTIVEIDPNVYNAARTWFGLQDPGKDNLFIQDARAWVEERHARIQDEQKEKKYDFVIHDCFSGGGVPDHIFTIEFWDKLKSAMSREGVLAVNFAGYIDSEASRLVVNTLERSFGQCRAFHDHFNHVTEDQYSSAFNNMVIFCTKSKKPLTFRDPRRSDWLGSPLRRHILGSLENREVNLNLIRANASDEDKYILTDQRNPLGELQRKQGRDHWELMREVLPDTHWETY